MSSPLVPAEPAATGDGTPYSALYDDVYHTAHGALAQARHVFLAGNTLPARWMEAERFVILETGFGLGLNFLATWQAWRESGARGRLCFVSVEKHPFRRDALATLLAAHAELGALAGELLRQWPPLTPGFHRLHFDAGRVTLTLLLGDAQTLLPQLAAHVDAVYLDGFAPAKNPALWSPPLLAAVSRLCRSHATLATWSVAGELRRTLQQFGWQVERRPGFAGKREMLRGVAGSPAPTLDLPCAPAERRAIVIGAGLAGIAISERLANRGWQIELFERHGAPAQEASGNPSGILLPHLAKDDALAARLSRACYLYALRRFADLADLRWSPCGVLQVARDAAHESLQRATVDQLGLPPDFAAFFEQDAAAALIGRPLAHGGWWFPGGGWVNPASVCSALLAAAGDAVDAHFDTEVSSLRRTADGWQAFDAAGRMLADAAHVVLANAHDANRLLAQALPLTPIRGQVSYLPPAIADAMMPPLHHVICRSGYITPPQAGTVCIGASFDSGDSDLRIRTADHAGNLQRLDELLPGAATDIDAALLDGRVGLRAATPDRLPLIGTLPDTSAIVGNAATLEKLPRLKGLHALLGLSARGMVWAPLAAELLASQLAGDPLPVERELARAVDPARFHLRDLRRGKAGL
ncbi:bifunctional tRNA (5-methylaminomethyl-2-thiouridine)(34)-methyltransferase MnmD/FAD-dependent 5-carboxymethylaminomethyl-2-thiouridine(34) oxidoreductase MnmC [Sulfuritalea sp.]|uniref:bifunctional tRNA (5-methylaminomethyl-2-thiouridine)(34)-methyltransferase MnmD/FAD-dependent 5-carboxymethylaminomethyl-2-thiouridine(34) oxidoreductase MnmC n=1 Tax=Sulfuritalea sp. TaxID=2480090 RepID=UPI00286E8580|nr:bifunctional tRNA (5-methylaminomethyl-2-thiouridine)(34)-methyltransferase MnmD/FAD-dependent 5-carboxymethylaminomethyl-2-thiouridine(34) oxidoreductase MnmC [Sulfuritalea sp.]